MAFSILRRSIHVPKTLDCNPFTRVFRHYSRLSNILKQIVPSENVKVASQSQKIPPLLAESRDTYSVDCRIGLVDTDTWKISSGLSEAWRGENVASETRSMHTELFDEKVSLAEDVSDFDEIDDMRVRDKLFFKIDRDSKEYEEYSYDFHRRSKSNSNSDRKENEDCKRKQKEERKESKKENPPNSFIPPGYEKGSFGIEKKTRNPTYNQLTGPYHEPFCLDIYVSKGSVRACIVHRATSNVVAVAHSISKDMKFDYSSKRDATTCAAVGALLAQRALADDIHDVVFTPRKGDKIEGKLQTVLQSVIDNGVSVKVKIKQRQIKRHLFPVWREKSEHL